MKKGVKHNLSTTCKSSWSIDIGLEGNANKLLRFQLVEPLSELSILSSEKFGVSSHGALIVFIVIRGSFPR